MNTPPIQLGNYHFTQINISAQRDNKLEDLERFDVDVMANAFPREKDKLREWCVFVMVEIKPKDGSSPCYLGKVEAFGLFSVIDSWKEDEIEKLVYVNGAGILYAAIREMICLVTSRCVYGALMIPSYSFAQLYKEWKEVKNKQAAATTQQVIAETSPAPITTAA